MLLIVEIVPLDFEIISLSASVKSTASRKNASHFIYIYIFIFLEHVNSSKLQSKIIFASYIFDSTFPVIIL
jgi:hypothetical protein